MKRRNREESGCIKKARVAITSQVPISLPRQFVQAFHGIAQVQLHLFALVEDGAILIAADDILMERSLARLALRP